MSPTAPQKRKLIDLVTDFRALFRRHQISGNALLAAFAHPDITDEQIVVMARSYGRTRQALRAALQQLNDSPKLLYSPTASSIVRSMQWPPTK